jgi:hypothetical protein
MKVLHNLEMVNKNDYVHKNYKHRLLLHGSQRAERPETFVAFRDIV